MKITKKKNTGFIHLWLLPWVTRWKSPKIDIYVLGSISYHYIRGRLKPQWKVRMAQLMNTRGFYKKLSWFWAEQNRNALQLTCHPHHLGFIILCQMSGTLRTAVSAILCTQNQVQINELHLLENYFKTNLSSEGVVYRADVFSSDPGVRVIWVFFLFRKLEITSS